MRDAEFILSRRDRMLMGGVASEEWGGECCE